MEKELYFYFDLFVLKKGISISIELENDICWYNCVLKKK